MVEAGNGDGADIVVVQCAMEENQRKRRLDLIHTHCMYTVQTINSIFFNKTTHLLSLKHKRSVHTGLPGLSWHETLHPRCSLCGSYPAVWEQHKHKGTQNILINKRLHLNKVIGKIKRNMYHCTLTHKFFMSVAPLNALLGIIWMTFSLKSLIRRVKYPVKWPIFINAKYNWNASFG